MRDSLSPSASRPTVERGGLARALRGLIMAAGTLLLAVAMVAPVAPAQAANPSAGFQPGNIISDANFYDGNAMSVAEVQIFLNKQVPSCWLGRPGYEVGKPVQWGGPTKLASKCLKDFRINTTTQTANAYCAAIPGIANETAASVIVRVAKACGISAKVLLVMLDKEQSLVSDPWPNENQYFLAMGYACPDSGPGNSANCDPSKGGFAKQVYRAAWQFKVYKAFPDSYRYKPFQTATIQWHPNVGCGTSQVKIENYATAGLYIYTPYRPNQAALNAGWGTGDACSTYGNRNFYNYYNAWFGSPTIYLHPALASLAERERAVLGAVTSNPTEVGGGIRQRFAGGEIYWHSETGPVVVRGGMLTGYKQRGDGAGQLGFPTAPEGPTPGGAAQRFQRGELFWRQSTGTLSVRNGIHKHFVENGALPVFGYPLADEAAGEPGTSSQVFQKAGITWGPEVGAQSIRTGMLTAYKERGGLAKVGFARASETSVPGGAWQPFSKADAYWSKARGVKWVVGGIRTTLGRHGGVQAIGFPLAAEYRTADGAVRQDFERASIIWSSGTGGGVLSGPLLAAYDANGVAAFGYPIGSVASVAGGISQEFGRGSAYMANGGKPVIVLGGVRTAFDRNGGVGKLGFPLAAEYRTTDGAVRQDFERASIIWSSGTGGGVLSGPLLAAYDANGVAAFGYPIGSVASVAGGISQEFGRGSVYMANGGKPVIVLGGVRTAFDRNGGVGKLGFPLAAEYRTTDGAVRQDFERASIIWSSGTGGGVLSGPLLAAYDANGVAAFGYPIGSVASVAGGISQEFGRGSVYMANGGKPVIVLGGVRTAFDRNGGVGKLGFPLAAEYRTADGAVRQDFERATVMWSPTGSSISVR